MADPLTQPFLMPLTTAPGPQVAERAAAETGGGAGERLPLLLVLGAAAVAGLVGAGNVAEVRRRVTARTR